MREVILKRETRIERIEQLAELAQKACYGDGEVPADQLDETKQFYMMGFFEGMQLGNKVSPEVFDVMFKDVSKFIQDRILTLMIKSRQ